jgi:hypothetical protein
MKILCSIILLLYFCLDLQENKKQSNDQIVKELIDGLINNKDLEVNKNDTIFISFKDSLKTITNYYLFDDKSFSSTIKTKYDSIRTTNCLYFYYRNSENNQSIYDFEFFRKNSSIGGNMMYIFSKNGRKNNLKIQITKESIE